MKFIIETGIPQHKMRYHSVGDYFENPDGSWTIQVSDLGDWRSEVAVALHELTEVCICIHKGIPEPDILAFDIDFEDNPLSVGEPGDDPRAPYYPEHQFSDAIERLFVPMLGLTWYQHNKNCESPFEDE